MSRNNRGMSFIELILVILIISVLATVSLAIYRSLGYANTKKVASHINDALSKARINTMSKKDTYYLYLYQIDGRLYSKLSTEDGLMVGVYGELTDAEGVAYSRNISLIYRTDSGISHELGDNESICISFIKSSGAFAVNFTELILKSDNNRSTITCVRETGRHWVY